MLRFADDIAIIAGDDINLERALECLDDILKSNYKMKINNNKKKQVMVCYKDSENINPLPPNVIYMSYRTANLQMLHFKYLFNKRPY
jgi:hypothetical protein